MKFSQGQVVCYKTSNGQTISGMVTSSKKLEVKACLHHHREGAPIEMFEVLFQDDTNSRALYLSRNDAGDYYTNFITGDKKAPASVEIADDC